MLEAIWSSITQYLIQVGNKPNRLAPKFLKEYVNLNGQCKLTVQLVAAIQVRSVRFLWLKKNYEQAF